MQGDEELCKDGLAQKVTFDWHYLFFIALFRYVLLSKNREGSGG